MKQKMSIPNPNDETYRVPMLSERKENRIEKFYDYYSLHGVIANFVGWLEWEMGLTIEQAKEIIENSRK